MAIRVALHHRTLYSYDHAVPLSPHEVRLRPAPHARTPIVSYSLRATPEPHFINWQQDPYGNWPDDRRARAARLRPRRHLEWSLARRLHVSRVAPGRAQLRHVPCERQRGRGTPVRALLAARAHAGTHAGPGGAAEPELSGHA